MEQTTTPCDIVPPHLSLDTERAFQVVKTFSDLVHEDRRAGIIVTHDLTETLRIADRVVIISQGKVYRDLTPQDVRESQDPFIRQFADGLPDGPVPFHVAATPYAQQLLSGS